jgi:hypothetical protein
MLARCCGWCFREGWCAVDNVNVTKEHRAAAAELLGDWLAHASLVRDWVESGDDMPNGDRFDGGDWVDEDDAELYYATAHAIAADGRRVRAAVIAELQAIANCADIVNQGSPVLYVRVDSIELLIETLEAQS